MQLIFLIGLVWHHPSEDSGSLLHRHISVPSNGINDVCLSTEQQSGWMSWSSNSHQSSIKISLVEVNHCESIQEKSLAYCILRSSPKVSQSIC